jgi:hypothetical protein
MLWAYIFINGSSENKWLGSMFYFPHAARVLCVVYFGYKSIPGLFLAEIFGPTAIYSEVYQYQVFLPSLISVLSVSAAISTLHIAGFSLGSSQKSPLNKRNYKHIALITIISALYNSIFANFSLSLLDPAFQTRNTDIEQVIRFALGDVVGTACVFIMLAIMLKPILASNTKKPRN